MATSWQNGKHPDFHQEPSAPPPSYETATTNPAAATTNPAAATTNPAEQDKQAKIAELCARLDISYPFQSSLYSLNEQHIICICDDSGSMKSSTDKHGTTRWAELKHAVSTILDIALIFDPLGMDLHFLNRESIYNIKSTGQLNTFNMLPAGGTPLVGKLADISRRYAGTRYSKLLIVATDGEPTDDDINYSGFKSVIRSLVQQGFHINFLICTDNDSQVAYINNIDRLYQQVDTTDDYATEKREVQRAQGRSFKFSYGDYIVKLLAGSIDVRLDSLDEKKLPATMLAPGSHMHYHPAAHICNIL